MPSTRCLIVCWIRGSGSAAVSISQPRYSEACKSSWLCCMLQKSISKSGTGTSRCRLYVWLPNARLDSPYDRRLGANAKPDVRDGRREPWSTVNKGEASCRRLVLQSATLVRRLVSLDRMVTDTRCLLVSYPLSRFSVLFPLTLPRRETKTQKKEENGPEVGSIDRLMCRANAEEVAEVCVCVFLCVCVPAKIWVGLAMGTFTRAGFQGRLWLTGPW
jgi:hypothetical protein